MPEMEYTTQALQAQQAAAAARAAEVRMREEGTDVASPPEFDEEQLEEDAEELGVDADASLDRSDGAELHGDMPAASAEGDASADSGEDMLDVDSADGTEVHDAGVKTS